MKRPASKRSRTNARRYACVLISSFCILHSSGTHAAGLDSLDEQQVMAQLANNNLSTLLQRDFDNFKIPENQRDQMLTLIKLKELANPTLNVAARRAMTVTVAKGMDSLLPRATDPAMEFEQANQLFLNGITPIVTELEYFGENPSAQADLRPAAETAKRMYEKVAALAGVKVDALSNQLTESNKDTLLSKLRALGQTRLYGLYSDNMANYALCISLAKTDPDRNKVAEETIAYLSQYDNSQSGIQSTVHLQIGKMQLVEGKYSDAKATFDSIATGTGITPPPDFSQQNNARYFAIVAEISSHKLKEAQSEIADMEIWQSASYLPKLTNPADQASVRAAMAMLKFRLYSAQSDLSTDEAEKKKQNDQAIDLLAQLVSEQPALKDLVFDQLIGRIPEQPDLTTLNPFVLQALMQQGIQEVIKKPEEKADETKLTRAVSAAKEIAGRKGQTGVDAAMTMRAAQFLGYAYDRLKDKKSAAAAFLDFAEKYSTDTAKAQDALDHATVLIGELRKQDRTTGDADQDTRKLFDRFLPLAINAPYNRKQFAFQYAAVLQEEHKYKDAVAYFKLVPETDSKYPNSQYLQMLALAEELGESTLTADDRKAISSQILELAKSIDALLVNAGTDQQRKQYLDWVVSADEIAADLTRREQKDPAGSLKILDGFEARIAASPDAAKAHVQALQLRIDDYRDMGNMDQATKALQDLMSVDVDQGKALTLGVLHTIDADMVTARAAGNTQELKQLAQDRAKLSGFVVSWASSSKDPKEQAALEGYQGYDADSKLEAAELVDDPSSRKAGLESAVKEYRDLIQKNPDNLPAQLGLGLASYSLGNYQDAIDYLAPLMDNAKVLRPTKEVTGAGGVITVVEDPQFWEANYKRLRSLVELYKQHPQDPAFKKDLTDANSYLGSLYIINGSKTGGKTYHDNYEKLKAEIKGLLK